MKTNKKTVNRIFCNDSVLLIAFAALAFATVYLILVQVLDIVENALLRIALLIVAGVSLLSLAGAITGVLIHLRKNKAEIYNEELYYQELIKQEKEHNQL